MPEQTAKSNKTECGLDDPIRACFRNAEQVNTSDAAFENRTAQTLGNAVRAATAQSPAVKATPFVWCDPSEIPPRDWLYGRHLIRRNISLTVAPGGVGKSSLTVVHALELATGRRLLGHWLPEKPVRVWLFNLEDERRELERRISAAMKHHRVSPTEIEGRLFVDTGREQELVLADQQRDDVRLNTLLVEHLSEELRKRAIDVLIVDPFVSSHRVNEMDNGKIDVVAKQWVRLAEECRCAIELVHHTRKLNGVEASSDSSRGASSLVNAARSSRVLQRLDEDELQECGVRSEGSTYFSVKRDKANLASAGDREFYRTVTVDLGQGDQVGVVERWRKPGLFDGVTLRDLKKVQEALGGKNLRYSAQTGEDWAGYTIASVLSLDPDKDKRRIKKLIEEWLKSGALTKVDMKLASGKTSPVLAVGEWATE
ncbi:AAA family ATPase [Thalassovita sp.]|uniref:AAA family ATPase n=1 Tax=Thalassovita sp. TaxID=1979401 RepID=UPI0029DE6A73|nr:AAA family ATPase [Thalassovita sp.]